MGSRATSLGVALYLCLAGCAGPRAPVRPPQRDPLATQPAERLHRLGRAYAATGDTVRALQYLGAALERGAPDVEVLPDLVEACVRSSQLQAALRWLEPYLRQHPNDRAMATVAGALREALRDTPAEDPR